MPLGDQPAWTRRNVVALLFNNGWVNVDNLLKMACTVEAESSSHPHAWHFNDPADGGNGTVDWGMFQLNDNLKGQPAPQRDVNGMAIPDSRVAAFVAEALDPAQAVLRARAMYVDRGFSPWYGFRQPNGTEPWRNHITVMSLAICNFLREKYGVPLL